jgi:hypothetical protein
MAQRGARLGARFLAGSAATNYGIICGSGLHLELALLHRIGLSPREAIAAATSNFADIDGWLDVGRIEPDVSPTCSSLTLPLVVTLKLSIIST